MLSEEERKQILKANIVEQSKTDLPGAVAALWRRIEYIAADDDKTLLDQDDWRRDLDGMQILVRLKDAGQLPEGFEIRIMKFYDPDQPAPEPVAGLEFIPLKSNSKNLDTGNLLKVGDHVVPYRFNLLASVLYLMCVEDKERAVKLAADIDDAKVFRPGEVLRILCTKGMREEAAAHLRALCHTDREFAIETARYTRFDSKVSACNRIEIEERMQILRKEGIDLDKTKPAPRSHIEHTGGLGTMGDALRKLASVTVAS